MNIGLAIFLSLFIILSMVPILLLVVDGYKQKNIKKGVYYIIGFFVFIGIGAFLVKTYKLWFAMAIPLLFLFFIIAKWLKNKLQK